MTDQTTAIETVSELKPCPFCNAPMVEVESFRTRITRTYTHAGTDDPCPGRGINLIVGEGADNAERLAMWNRRSLDTADGVGANWTRADLAEAMQLAGFEDATLADADDVLAHLSLCSATNPPTSRTPNTETVVKAEPNADMQFGKAVVTPLYASPPSPAEVTEPVVGKFVYQKSAIDALNDQFYADDEPPSASSASVVPEVTEDMVDASLRGWYSSDYDPAKISPYVLEYHRAKARAALTAALQLGKKG